MLEDKNPNWLLPMLAAIRTRPGSYLGAEEIRDLMRLTFGYKWARGDLGLCQESASDKEWLDQFGEWLNRRAAVPAHNTPWWMYQIYSLDPSDKNIHTFFKFFEEFLQTKGQSLDAIEGWIPHAIRRLFPSDWPREETTKTDVPEDKNPNWLLPMLAAIRTKPGIYIGAETIHALDLFTFGYEEARDDLGICGMSASDKEWLAKFGEWLALRAAEPELGSREWSHQIYWLDPSDKNIHTFFKLFEEFLQTKGQSLDAVERWVPTFSSD